ncbi:hypothetical protein EJB05_48574, partial [Eragrostis curvula]
MPAHRRAASLPVVFFSPRLLTSWASQAPMGMAAMVSLASSVELAQACGDAPWVLQLHGNQRLPVLRLVLPHSGRPFVSPAPPMACSSTVRRKAYQAHEQKSDVQRRATKTSSASCCYGEGQGYGHDQVLEALTTSPKAGRVRWSDVEAGAGGEEVGEANDEITTGRGMKLYTGITHLEGKQGVAWES